MSKAYILDYEIDRRYVFDRLQLSRAYVNIEKKNGRRCIYEEIKYSRLWPAVVILCIH